MNKQTQIGWFVVFRCNNQCCTLTLLEKSSEVEELGRSSSGRFFIYLLFFFDQSKVVRCRRHMFPPPSAATTTKCLWEALQTHSPASETSITFKSYFFFFCYQRVADFYFFFNHTHHRVLFQIESALKTWHFRVHNQLHSAHPLRLNGREMPRVMELLNYFSSPPWEALYITFDFLLLQAAFLWFDSVSLLDRSFFIYIYFMSLDY